MSAEPEKDSLADAIAQAERRGGLEAIVAAQGRDMAEVKDVLKAMRTCLNEIRTNTAVNKAKLVIYGGAGMLLVGGLIQWVASGGLSGPG